MPQHRLQPFFRQHPLLLLSGHSPDPRLGSRHQPGPSAEPLGLPAQRALPPRGRCPLGRRCPHWGTLSPQLLPPRNAALLTLTSCSNFQFLYLLSSSYKFTKNQDRLHNSTVLWCPHRMRSLLPFSHLTYGFHRRRPFSPPVPLLHGKRKSHLLPSGLSVISQSLSIFIWFYFYHLHVPQTFQSEANQPHSERLYKRTNLILNIKMQISDAFVQ